jgi:hypothetical protein
MVYIHQSKDTEWMSRYLKKKNPNNRLLKLINDSVKLQNTKST